MKFLLINNMRIIVYMTYFAIILYGIWTGLYNQGLVSAHLPAVAEGSGLAKGLDVALGFFGGWIIASIVCGLVVTVLDIRDDINDRLPDARQDI